MNKILYAIYVISLLFLGFVMTSRGTKVTEKLKTQVSIVNVILLTSILILAFLEKSVALAVSAVALYLIVPGIGQTLTLVLMSNPIAFLPLLIIAIFFAVFAYARIFGRI